ncbi:ATP-dependent DNA helicase RecG [[Clostridium] fimetarium]|uniref:ATP-dependent DNA helicase RecG n=1 Tax=[Clostridium] fimetarium TaxID=99656 RepID=A0A1I0QL87_9FIRM|nr:ATP-dependent DNA helicase RecG [[Clostridium] fimetarium]SEW27856.1 ATP-dependent DNA helicase RecG [[Clostridium] fimetarium]
MQLKDLKGIGAKTSDLLNKLSIFSVEDLVDFYPRDYDVYENTIFVNDINDYLDKPAIAIDGIVANTPDMKRISNLMIISTIIKDEKGQGIKATWFNMPYLKTTLRMGYRFVFRGRVIFKNGAYVMEQPVMYTMSDYAKLLNEMQPIYALTKGLSNKIVTKAVAQALEIFSLQKDYIPQYVREKYKLTEYNFAIKNIHFPKNMEIFCEARKRLVFEEFFMFIMSIRQLKDNNDLQPNHFHIQNDDRTDKMIERLPYRLTNAQLKAWAEVKQNMSSDKLMNRLIQGDVGSGKTIIATLALMNTVYKGYQAAMMVPTEVLAKQQYASIRQLFAEYNIDIKLSLLTGSLTAKEKTLEYERIQSGEAQIVIGTHALIQEKVQYDNLALVITDEQHRFGVNQREALSNKGKEPHILVMSATPIPRTLAIIIYGDLDISIIDEMPSNRLPIKNCVVGESYRPKAYQFISEQVSQGRQAYVICPMVEESENVEAENVVDYSMMLKEGMPKIMTSDGTFKTVSIEYLHGKMKSSMKNEIMEKFTAGQIDVLVSTTVIEVGVNVPNSTVMLIENADRFGLAQLHQLRGRVGRGGDQSYCIFVSDSRSKKTKERLDILNKSNDGFKIAEEDMKLRGPGDFFGIRQSGIMEFGIGDIFTDALILKDASDAVNEIMTIDPELLRDENQILKEKLLKQTEKLINKLNI